VAATDRPGDVEAFLEGSGLGLDVFRSVLDAVPDAEVRVTKSQIGFRRRRAFAWLWRPRRYLGQRGAELVVSIALPRRDTSPRWKQVVQPSPPSWMHHLELADAEQIDGEAVAWLREAADWASSER
jgi:Domain of unknown function (DUF5655)